MRAIATSGPIWKHWPIGLLALLLPLTACVNGGIAGQRPGPDEEVWTIRCAALRGPERYRQAEACVAALKQIAGLKPDRVQVIHGDEESVVYYGWYRRTYDPAKNEHRYTPNQLPDIELIRSLSLMINGRLSFPFIYATLEERPPTRSRHPEWDLAQADGYWSLHVAVFFNDETIMNRRYLAEEYCDELRGQGVEAYYHHGPAHSSVCVGLFPKPAVQTMMQKDQWTGSMQAVNRIVDERLLELQRQFPYSFQNAQKLSEIVRDPKTGEIKERIPLASFVVIVPRAEAAEQGRSGG